MERSLPRSRQKVDRCRFSLTHLTANRSGCEEESFFLEGIREEDSTACQDSPGSNCQPPCESVLGWQEITVYSPLLLGLSVTNHLLTLDL